MKVINNGVLKEYKLLTRFKLDNNQEYVIFANPEVEGELYLSGIVYENDKIKLIAPDKDKVFDIKKIIENLISNNPNSFIFSQLKYYYIDMEMIADKEFIDEQKQKLQLTPDQYKNLCNNDYLTYPYKNIINKKVDKKYSKNNMIYSIISAIVLILFFGFLIYKIPDFKNTILKYDLICMLISSFNIQNIFAISNTIPYILFQLSVITLLFAMFSYDSDENHPIIFYIICLFMIFGISIVYLDSIHLISLKNINETIIKVFGLYSIIHSFIVMLVYYSAKKISTTITNLLKVKNFVVHYAIFLILFLFVLVGVVLFYNNFLYNGVNDFINKSIIGGAYYG